MRAVIQKRYGPPSVLRTEEIDKPAIGDNDVLVKVHAAALHVGDLFSVRGSPFMVRLSTGFLGPKRGVPGFDLAGTVEAVGSAVTGFMPGDAVFGVGRGTCAEYTSASADDLVHKPAGLTFEQAASLPTSALAALHGLRDAGKLVRGQRLLINGASGGVGTFAVQIAKSMGAHVTGVCGTANVDMVRSLGADEVLDYRTTDFTVGTARYDLILDNVENHPLSAVRRALTPTGTLVLNSGTGAGGLRMLVRLARPLLISPFTSQKLKRYLSMPRQADLAELARLADAGALRPVIDRTFPLAETADALRHIETGHARGKVIVAVA